jgi:hypothetical protein
MYTELTLRLQESLVQKAKYWAEINRTSVSQMVADFFERLPQENSFIHGELNPRVQSLTSRTLPVDARPEHDMKKEYMDYLEAKHR